MYESPRVRRLRSDLAAMERLQGESSVLKFRTLRGDNRLPPQHYVVSFHGKSLVRERGPVGTRNLHEVEIKLGASYPRTMPELRWLTPIYHPNISEIGMVCLGGYGTHWVPSLNLDELCGMLWDMARYYNYDIRSPYNREAALWVANQTSYLFPLDTRPLRDLRAAQGRIAPEPTKPPDEPPPTDGAQTVPPQALAVAEQPRTKPDRVREFTRKSAKDSPSKVGSAFESPPPPVWEADNSPLTEGVVILDMEVDLRPRNQRPQPSNEEIVFID